MFLFDSPLARKCGMMCCRQCFRNNAKEIGFIKLWYIYRSGSSFAVVHKVTKQAIKHPSSSGKDKNYVELTPYKDNNNPAILWTEQNGNNGYKTIKLPRSAQYEFWYPWCHVPKDGVRLQLWTAGWPDSRTWKIISRGTQSDGSASGDKGSKGGSSSDNKAKESEFDVKESTQTYNIFCKVDPNYFLAIKEGKLVFAPAYEYATQEWYMHRTSSSKFVVVHKATGLAIKYPSNGTNAELVPYSANKKDASIFWVEEDVKDIDGYKAIKTTTNGSSPFWYPVGKVPDDGSKLHMRKDEGIYGKLWKTIPLPHKWNPKKGIFGYPSRTLSLTAPLVRIYSKLDSSLFLAIRKDQVVLATANSSDDFQKWYIYKAENGSSFALVNKATGQAIKQNLGYQKVGVGPYYNTKDESLLWSECDIQDEDGFVSIKMGLNNSNQVLDVEKAVAKDGTPIFCWESNKQTNQRWIMIPSAQSPPSAQLVRIYSKAGPNYSLAARRGRVMLVSPNPYDKYQQWYKVDASSHVNEDNGYACSVFVNRMTGNAIKLSSDAPLDLTPFENTNDTTTVWTERSLDDGYKVLRNVSNSKWFFNTESGKAGDEVITENFNNWTGGNGQRWKMAPCVAFPLNKLLVRVYCKDRSDFCLTIKNGKVVVGLSDFRDKFQLWYKVDASEQVHDEDNFQWPCFALVNQASGEAIKHLTSNQTVELTQYFSDTDKSTLWFEYSLADGSKAMKPVTKTLLSLESLSDPTKYDVSLGCFSCTAKGNQRWFISPSDQAPRFLGAPIKLRVYTKNGSDYVITVKNNKVVLSVFNPNDNSQAWYRETTKKDENGFPCFALINKSTSLAIKQPSTIGQPLQLVTYNPNVPDKSIMWSEWSLSDGYVAIGLMNGNTHMTWNAQGGASDGVIVGCDYWNGNNNQRWRIGFH